MSHMSLSMCLCAVSKKEKHMTRLRWIKREWKEEPFELAYAWHEPCSTFVWNHYAQCSRGKESRLSNIMEASISFISNVPIKMTKGYVKPINVTRYTLTACLSFLFHINLCQRSTMSNINCTLIKIGLCRLKIIAKMVSFKQMLLNIFVWALKCIEWDTINFKIKKELIFIVWKCSNGL